MVTNGCYGNKWLLWLPEVVLVTNGDRWKRETLVVINLDVHRDRILQIMEDTLDELLTEQGDTK